MAVIWVIVRDCSGEISLPKLVIFQGARMVNTRENDLYVTFHTTRWPPGHRVSLTTDVDGWDYQIEGRFESLPDGRGRWAFRLGDGYAGSPGDRVAIRFVLDGRHPMERDQFLIARSGSHNFDDGAVTFGEVPARYRHGHDNLHTFETPVQQNLFRANRDEAVHYDVVVIGSGMSGGILADDLADRGAKVLLLEAGSLLFPTHIYNLPGSWDPLKDQYFVYQHELAPGSTFEGGVKVNFGGGSVFWSGIIQEANEWEFGSAWPVSVLRYLLHEGGYARATQLMRRQLTRGPYEDELVARLSARFPEHRVRRLPRARHQPHLTELPDGRVVLQNVIRESNGMFSTVDLLSDSLSYPGAAGNENLTVNLNHMVTRIETEGRRAVGVVCEDLLSNTRRRYSARFVVLAAGSLGSTRIALQSALSDPGGLIGKGLSDHPNFSIRTEWPLREAPIGREDHAKLMLQHNAASHGQQPFNIEVLVNYQYWDRRVADEDVWRQQIVQPMDRIGMDVQFFFPSALDEGNHVSLNADSRKLSVFTGENTSGLVHRDEVRAVADALLAEIGGGVTPSYSGDLRYFRAAQIGHLGGTLRMGAAGSGVVDETQRFHGYDNLYVADLSAFPSILAAKPTLTLAALSLRLADTLIDQLPHLSGDPNRRGIRSRIAMVAPGFA